MRFHVVHEVECPFWGGCESGDVEVGRTVKKQANRGGSDRSSGRSGHRRGADALSSPTKHEDTCKLRVMDYRKFLDSLESDSVDLMLTDPPYAISRKTGFQHVGKNGVDRLAVNMDFGKWDRSEIDLSALAEKAFRVIRGGGGGNNLL